jgi:hypothetical protein
MRVAITDTAINKAKRDAAKDGKRRELTSSRRSYRSTSLGAKYSFSSGSTIDTHPPEGELIFIVRCGIR